MAKKENLKERLRKQRKKLNEKGSGNIVFLKKGVTRLRILQVGDDNDWFFEMVHYAKVCRIEKLTGGIEGV